MLGLSDSKGSARCDYEQRSVVTRPKASKAKEHASKLANHRGRPPSMEVQRCCTPKAAAPEGSFGQGNVAAAAASAAGFAAPPDNITSPELQNDKQDEERIDLENSVTFYTSPERNEENSKAFIESLGSWINDLFHVPNKNAQTSSEMQKDEVQKQELSDEDAEYLKSISAIKEQFRKKLKSETSISVSVPEKPFVFNFDRVLDSGKKTKKGARSLPPPVTDTSVDWMDDLNVLDGHLAEAVEVPVRRYDSNLNSTGLIIRTNDFEASLKPPSRAKTNLKELTNSSILTKEKKKGKNKNRPDISDLEEYVFPTPSELSKRILLNVNENEKTGKIYKNSHHGVQETQPYCQRKARSHQTNARCYTTKAETPKNPVSKRGESYSYYSTTSVMDAGTDELLRRSTMDLRKNQLRKPTKKEISEITRDSMTFLKMKGKSTRNSHGGDAAKAEGKTSSDELVKYLMKKIKTTRPHNPKNKSSSNVPQLLTTPKTRFMQSATNTLVSVLTKNDGQLPAKSIARVFPEPRKELILKNDANIRVDVSRAIAASKYSRLTYLLEDNNRVEEDCYLLDKERFRGSKRSYEELLKQEGKKSNGKFNKRQEVKHMLSKIDAKFTPFQAAKRLKEPKKKPIEELIHVSEVREEQEGNPRFQKQHELFKTNLKMMQQAEAEEPKVEVQQVSASPSPLSTQLAVIETDLPLNAEPPAEKPETVEEANSSEELMQSPEMEEFDCKVSELLELDEKPTGQKTDKQDKSYKAKSLDFLKDPDTKMMLSPLEKLYMSEQREAPKSFEPSHGSSDLAQAKPPDAFLFNRRFSTNSLTESSPRSKPPVLWCGSSKTPPISEGDGKETNGDGKKDAKDKKKVKNTKTNGSKESSGESPCGFESTKKKPGPNCENEE